MPDTTKLPLREPEAAMAAAGNGGIGVRAVLRSEGLIRGSVQLVESFIWDRDHESRGRLWKLPLRWVRILDLTLQGYKRHVGSLRAAALTYTTVLTAVPLFAVGFSILKVFGVQERIASEIIERLVGGDPDNVKTTVQNVIDFIRNAEEYISKTPVGGLGSIGGVVLFFTSFSLLSTIEGALNAVWGVKKGRTMARRATDYLAVLVLAPLLIFTGSYVKQLLHQEGSLVWAGPLAAVLNNVVLGPFFYILPYLTIWAAFIFIYKFVPNARVPWNSALIAGIFGGTIWMIAQEYYVHYSFQITQSRFNPIFGSFAWLLVLLVWIYLSWGILLFGAELGCAHQFLDESVRRKRSWGGTPVQKETLALRLGVLLARPMLAPVGVTNEPVTLEHLMDELRLPPGPVTEMLESFEVAGLAARSESDNSYMLRRIPDEIRLLDLLCLARHGSLCPDLPTPEDGPGILDGLAEALNSADGARTLRDIVDRPIEQVRTFTLMREK